MLAGKGDTEGEGGEEEGWKGRANKVAMVKQGKKLSPKNDGEGGQRQTTPISKETTA